MKINGSDPPKSRKAESPAAAATQARSNGAKAASAEANAGTAAAGSPTIHLSGRPTELQALASSLAASGQFDADKVDAIKQAIRDGDLRIDPEAIADKMLAELGAMLGRAPKA